jgi:hypothetical protein
MKRMSCLTVVALLSVVSLGCPSNRDKGAARGTAAKGAAARSTEDRLRAFYPATLGGFYRTDVKRYDELGENASVGYNLFSDTGETRIAFTAYFFPAKEGQSFDDAVKQATNEVRGERRGVKVLATEPVKTRQAGQDYEGRKVTFNYADEFGRGEKQPLVSELYLFKKGDKLVKHRVTYPAADAAYVQQRLAAFLPAFPWPSGI